MFHLSKSKYINFKNLLQTADDLIGRIPTVKKRRRLNLSYKILKYFYFTIVFLFLLLLILLWPQIFSLKQIYDQVNQGKVNIEQAVVFAKQNDFSQAANLAKIAESNFNISINKIEEIKNNNFLSHLPLVVSQLNNAESFLISAQFLSKALAHGANFCLSLEALLSGDEKFNFSKLSLEEKRNVLRKIFESAPELNGIKADLDLAYINLEQINTKSILFALQDKIERIKRQINEASFILEKAVPLSQMIPALAGYPSQVNYLVVLQNNDELRPTGGFLGTYGILKIKDGNIVNFDTHDIYHLDMPVQDKINIEPPEPIKKYLNDKWYLRDANWSPDWPTAAKTINQFYQIESGLNSGVEKISEFSGVLALTPKLITDFLKITGPIIVEGQSYDQNNFQDLLQYRVEKGYQILGVSKWQRKEVIGEISRELKIKIFDLPPNKWSELINIVINNLIEKNLLFYFTDNQLENIAVQNGWAGEIKNYYSDYFMVVDANLAALKTDAVMRRSINYKVTEGPNGLFSKLTVNYAHNGKPDWKTSAYKSYTRVYAPLGSQLIKISGYETEQIDTGNEAGKTWFGFYLTVAPGKINNITVEYKLPRSIMLNNNYGLYIQKQPGKELNDLLVDLSFKNGIKSYNPVSLYTRKINSRRIQWQGDLSMDRSFQINF
ncbi:DUF4012 domain-containing protein [Patescibacteria group bacterium]|nr:DUF4012 domain-containing protein [Patescibacteria group bacterium]MBU1663371.1 DUF4012 domain-containing protein [Patescibacteria group bacterium]MBU1934340.1 DUF4012 domain-containing protein [Patescibacteria group bacterium]